MWKSHWNKVCGLFIILGAASLVTILVTSADGSGDIEPDPDWNTEVADATTCVGVDSQIALDSDGNPHIVHYDSTNQALRHSYLVSERKLGFFVQIKEDEDFNRRNTLSISRIKI